MLSLVVQTSFLGDVVLTTPLIAELARRGPVDVVTTVAGAAVLKNHPAIRHVIAYDKRGKDTGLAGFVRTVRRIRETDRYESAYMAQGSVRSALLALAAGVKERMGFNTSAGRALYTSRLLYRPDRHHAERLWWLSMSDCADEPNAQQVAPSLYPSPEDCASVDDLLRPFTPKRSRPFVALAPGSAWGTKRWPYFPELASMLAETHDVVVTGGPEDFSLGQAILAELPPETGTNAAGKLGILGSAELIRRSAALVTNDSAPLHLASAMRTATIAVFGPTVPEFGFGPLAARSAVAGNDELACRPCDSHGPDRCPLGHWRCMRELSAVRVFGLLTQTVF